MDVPEVTFCIPHLASPASAPQHPRMSRFRHTLALPFNVPALLCWLAVALLLPREGAALAWLAMAGFAVAYVLGNVASHAWTIAICLLLEALCALLLVRLVPDNGVTPALLVILAAQLTLRCPPGFALALLFAVNLALYFALGGLRDARALLVTVVFLSFQAFAALIAHFARRAEAARDRLTLVNADLLATRALLADSARDTERLRVARELHDVAGHKLTALILNLRALEADPALADRHAIATARRLSQELLDEIRSVVHSLRDSGGLDLATALRALAAPLPKPRLALHIADDVRITDPALADTVLRIVQEALTNSARHAGAGEVTVTLARRAAQLELAIEDDGRLRGPLREGHGLAGMRERLAAHGGALSVSKGKGGALRIVATVPA